MTKLEEALDELERNHSSTDCQQAAAAERVRALVAEARAELARLKPSGQVAEDVAMAKKYMHRVPEWQECHDAVDRLAAQAQAFDAAERRCAELERYKAEMDKALDSTNAMARELMVERDTWRQCAEERQQAAQQQMADKHVIAAERDAAVADNARFQQLLVGLALSPLLRQYSPGDADEIDATIGGRPLKGPRGGWTHSEPLKPHPGAALLEQFRKEVAQARNEGLETIALQLDAHGDWKLEISGTRLAKNIRAMKTDAPEPWPTTEYAKRTVRELVELLNSYAAGEDGNKDVMERVKRFLEERGRMVLALSGFRTLARNLTDAKDETRILIGRELLERIAFYKLVGVLNSA